MRKWLWGGRGRLVSKPQQRNLQAKGHDLFTEHPGPRNGALCCELLLKFPFWRKDQRRSLNSKYTIQWVSSVDSHHPGIHPRAFSFLSSLKVYVVIRPSFISGALGLCWVIIRDVISTMESLGGLRRISGHKEPSICKTIHGLFRPFMDSIQSHHQMAIRSFSTLGTWDPHWNKHRICTQLCEILEIFHFIWGWCWAISWSWLPPRSILFLLISAPSTFPPLQCLSQAVHHPMQVTHLVPLG